MLIHVIADFGYMDLAFAEVTQRMKALIPGAMVHCTTVPPFATLAAGFCAAQLALNEGPSDMAVFINVAPRKDDTAARSDNAGEALVLARLKNGRTVVGVNAGHSLSFLASEAESLTRLQVPNAGTQFRSRDIYPGALARVLEGDHTVFGESLSPAEIAPVPTSSMAYVDGFGNIKLTLTEEFRLPAGEMLEVTIGGVTLPARVGTAAFGVSQGELTLTVGSSGWSGTRYRELFLRGGSAWERFGRPAPEQPVVIRQLADEAVR